MNFAWPGLILGALILGVIYRSVYEIFIVRTGASEVGVFIYIFLFFQMTLIELEITTPLSEMLKSLLFLLVIVWFVRLRVASATEPRPAVRLRGACVSVGSNQKGNRVVRLAVVSPGPVFYQVPLYRRIARDPRLKTRCLFYSSSAGIRPYDAGFGSLGRSSGMSICSRGIRQSFSAWPRTGQREEASLTLRDWDLFGHILRGHYDVVWLSGYSYLTMWIGLLAGVLSGSRVFIRDDQTLLHPRPRPKRWVRAAVLRGIFSVAGGFYVGQNNREFFLQHGVRSDRLKFVPHAVDGASLTGAAPSKDKARARFGLSQEGPVVLFVGKLVPKKAPELLLKAFATVRRNRACQLLLVGEGPLEDSLKAFVAANRIEDVHFAGFLNRSEISWAYASADVLVLPSDLHETWGLVVNEAMHFALPIIASDRVGAARDLIINGKNGFVFRSGNVNELVEVLEAIVSHPDRSREFGLESLKIVESWSVDAAASAVSDACLETVLRSRFAERVTVQ